MEDQLTFSFYDSCLSFSLENIFETNLEHLELEQIQPRIEQLEKRGYRFLQSWSMDFYSPDRVVFPDGRIMDNNELCEYEINSEKGSTKYLEAREALEYFGLVDSYPYTEERWTEYPSFLDDEDESQTRERYNKVAA